MPFPVQFAPATFNPKYRDGREGTAVLREATLNDADVWERDWRPAYADQPYARWPLRDAIGRARTEQGLLCLAIAAHPTGRVEADRLEALMVVSIEKNGSRLEPWSDLIYIEYLIVAPHNRPPLRELPGLGGVMVRTAAQLSHEVALSGRVGLHSKPEAEAFYRDKLGMISVGYELTADGSLLFFEWGTT